MKTRHGFVSNSSSSSFVVPTSAYETVYDLAKDMLFVRQLAWEDEESEQLMFKCDEIKKDSTKSDLGVSFETTNERTFIRRMGDWYIVQTCHNHDWSDYIKGYSGLVKDIIPLLREDGYNLDEHGIHGESDDDVSYLWEYLGFYLCTRGMYYYLDHGYLIGHKWRPQGRISTTCMQCKSYDLVQLYDGKVICPECFWERVLKDWEKELK